MPNHTGSFSVGVRNPLSSKLHKAHCVMLAGMAFALLFGGGALADQEQQRPAAERARTTIQSGIIQKRVTEILKLRKLDATRISDVETMQDGLLVGTPFLGTGQVAGSGLTLEAIEDIRRSMPIVPDFVEEESHDLPQEVRDANASVSSRTAQAARLSANDRTVEATRNPDAAAQISRDKLTVKNSAVLAKIDPQIVEGLFDANQSPAPIQKGTSFSRTNDPGIAASNDFLTVVSYNRIAFYDKSTLQLLGSKPGSSGGFNNNVRAMELFQPIWDPSNPNNVNSYLNLPSNLACDPTLDPAAFPDETKYCLDDYYDLRVTWDRSRQRFWIVGLARNSDARGSDKPYDVLVGRRSVVIAAVSKTSDPRDGFHLYWWPAPIEMGFCNETSNVPATKCNGAQEYRPGDAGDYPTLAVSHDYLMVGVGIANVINAKWNKENPDEEVRTGRYSAMHVFRADELANGLVNGCPAPCGWTYWRIPARGGSHTYGALQPARRTDGAYTTKSFFVTSARDGLGVYGIDQMRSSKTYPLLFSAFVPFNRTIPSNVGDNLNGVKDAPLPGTSDTMRIANLGNLVISAFYRTGMIYAVMQDCIDWTSAQSGCSTSIRLVRANIGNMLNLSPFPGGQNASTWSDPDNNELSGDPYFFDRTFGLRGPGDTSNAVVYYGNPALAVTNKGDVGIVYMRAGETVFPEARYTLLRHDGTDVLKSRLLAAGDVALTGNYDTGGAELDPDGETLWFAHVFGDGDRPRFVISAVKP